MYIMIYWAQDIWLCKLYGFVSYMALQMAEVQAKMEEVEKAGTDGRNEVMCP